MKGRIRERKSKRERICTAAYSASKLVEETAYSSQQSPKVFHHDKHIPRTMVEDKELLAASFNLLYLLQRSSQQYQKTSVPN